MANTNNFISISDREKIEIKGVNEIISYDSEKIVFALENTNLTISGSNFNIKKFDVENKAAEVLGCLNSLIFSNKSTNINKSFLTSLFK